MITYLNQLLYLFAVRYIKRANMCEDIPRRRSVFKLTWRYARVQRWYDAQHKREMSWKWRTT